MVEKLTKNGQKLTKKWIKMDKTDKNGHAMDQKWLKN